MTNNDNHTNSSEEIKESNVIETIKESNSELSLYEAFVHANITSLEIQTKCKNDNFDDKNNETNQEKNDFMIENVIDAQEKQSFSEMEYIDSENLNSFDNQENLIPSEIRNIDWTYNAPKLISCAISDFQQSISINPCDNYLRGCLWSPDGSCILTNSHDNVLRIFNLPSILYNLEDLQNSATPEEMVSVLNMREKELIYDYCWYPLMCSSDPVSCCLASTSRRNPIRLWDAFTGTIRATYRPMNHLGEAISASSISFSTNGQRLYAGFNRFVQIFDISRPGSDSIRRPKLGKKPSQGGIISCIGVLNDPERNMYVTGSYNGTICVWSEPGNLVAKLSGHPAGVTQVNLFQKFNNVSGAPWYVCAGGRMDSRIFIWDARNLRDPIAVVHRCVENHQRFQYDIEPMGQYLFTGSQIGLVFVYDLNNCIDESCADKSISPVLKWRAHIDSANGISVHPSLPILATASGQRRIQSPNTRTNRSHKLPQLKLSDVSNVVKQLSSDSDSTDEEILTDTEVEMIVSFDLKNSENQCYGRDLHKLTKSLTSLPPENRLNLWAFPHLPTV